MSITVVVVWLSYGLIMLAISKWAQGGNALLPGRVGMAVQAFAYIATYVSAVALVGFGGLCHRYGLQMLIIAAGNVWLGTWFVYRYLAWPTRLFQRRYNAHTPAQLLGRAYESRSLQIFLGFLSAALLIVYGSAVFKGAALMIAGVLPIDSNTALIVLVGLVGLSVMWGGLRGVLYTEALQGLIMVIGVFALLMSVFRELGSPAAALAGLAQLPPTAEANRGFMALSNGEQGMNIISMALVTSVGIWAQPQMIQRHFALSGRSETLKVAPIAMLALVVVVGGMYLVGALSRLIITSDTISVDRVIPTLVDLLMSEFGRQLFALAVVSASLSTASAILHIASGSIWNDVLMSKSAQEGHGPAWRITVLFSVLGCGIFALKSSSIIAVICTTSWSLLAAATIVPYLSLLLKGPVLGKGALFSSVSGIFGCSSWYFVSWCIKSSIAPLGLHLPASLAMVPPIVPGILLSLAVGLGFVVLSGDKLTSMDKRGEVQ